MTDRILVVDDDPDVRELFNNYLGASGFAITEAADAATLRQLMKDETFDLILLDQRLPDDDGLTLAREMRAASEVGIIIITGYGQAVDRIVGLEVGADDYISKPVDLRELLARIRSVLRRRGSSKRDTAMPMQFDGWTISPSARQLLNPQGEAIELTSGEFDLLLAFVRNPNRVLTRDELMNLLHNREAGPFDRAIDVQVGRLRRKIENTPSRPELIKSVRGAGYLFAAKVQG